MRGARFDGAEDVNAAVVVGEDEVGVQGHGEGDRFRAMPQGSSPGAVDAILEALPALSARR